jgi:hypothetical protein
MPSLYDLLAQSMLFEGCKAKGLAPTPVAEGFQTPKPFPRSAKDYGNDLTPEIVLRNPIWQFSWDPSEPATFRDVTIRSRGMGMDYQMPMGVFDQIEFRQVRVKRQDGSKIDLLLDPAHMLGAWWARTGEIGDNASGLWQLPAELDVSLLVCFGYSLDSNTPSPLTMADVEALGDSLMPATGLGPRAFDFIAGKSVSTWVCVGPVRYIVAVELVLHKERNDFVPGEFMGFSRMHPHLLFWSNEDTRRVETNIIFARPKHGMAHGDAMGTEHKALLVADTNYEHDPSAVIGLPVPTTDRLYDYYDPEPTERLASRSKGEYDHPLQKPNEFTLADSRFKRGRVLPDRIQRRSPLVRNDTDCIKEPRQGQFDNVHIAPRMKLVMTNVIGRKTQIDDLVMLNACVHDCTHMHVRWSAFLSDKILKGWKHGRPFMEPGAPLVPDNQTVFGSLPNSHTLRYRAISNKDEAGKLVVFCHHGLAYAMGQWPTGDAAGKLLAMQNVMNQLAIQFEEPYYSDVANDEWSLFYFRVRFIGKHNYLEERSKFDLEECMA